MSDERLKKSTDAARTDRAMLDRAVTESRELTEDDRLRMFQQQLYNSQLPDLPKIPGYHVCWLTTTNPSDSIQRRVRLGYVPVKPEDVPGWDFATLKSGEHAGMIGVNEMVAFKLPQRLYEMYMKESHHDAPLREEEKLAEVTRQIAENARQTSGRDLDMGDGMEQLVQERGQPLFEA